MAMDKVLAVFALAALLAVVSAKLDDSDFPPTCFNKIQDGRESDVDCGGGDCRNCDVHRRCYSDYDCDLGNCVPVNGRLQCEWPVISDVWDNGDH
eukprot:m51a1_g2412 hypothetical protein (95) ;mRNA; r:796521-796805